MCHGPKRRVVEWVSQLVSTFEIHIDSQPVNDLDSDPLIFHHVQSLPGPHVPNFISRFGPDRLRSPALSREFMRIKHSERVSALRQHRPAVTSLGMVTVKEFTATFLANFSAQRPHNCAGWR